MSQDKKIPLKAVYSRINRTLVKKHDKCYRLKLYVLPVIYWVIAHYLRTPGLFFHKAIIHLAIKLWFTGARTTVGYRQMVTLPVDSVRYFEFDFIWHSITSMPLFERYLDVSSPRMFPLIMLHTNPELKAELVNPDVNDLEITRELFKWCGFSDRCSFHGDLVDCLEFAPESFDLITCISVIEHIPENGDQIAIAKMWELLKPGGRLLLSVPCAANPFEEYIDYNEYKLLTADENNFVFGQRFYNDALLRERIFGVTGTPIKFKIFGEKQFGFSIQNREAKMNNSNYPYWQEPFIMGKHFAPFSSIDELPGWGVIAMEFRKS